MMGHLQKRSWFIHRQQLQMSVGVPTRVFPPVLAATQAENKKLYKLFSLRNIDK